MCHSAACLHQLHSMSSKWIVAAAGRHCTASAGAGGVGEAEAQVQAAGLSGDRSSDQIPGSGKDGRGFLEWGASDSHSILFSCRQE